MASYTERFLQLQGANALQNYVVPPYKRAVVKSVVCTNLSTVEEIMWIDIGGLLFAQFGVPATNSSRLFEVRGVAYAGQAIHGQGQGPDIRMYVSGYLFDDPGNSGSATKPSDPDEPQRPEVEPRAIP